MTITQLIYFMEIAKTKNFTVAASNQFVAQSSLSYAIRELENELDVQLFIRRPNKKIELTTYGEELLPYVEEGLRLLEDGKNRIVSMRSPFHGKVRVAFFHSIVFSAIPTLMSSFREDNPGNEIEFETLVYHNWVDFRQMLLDGKCDLVFSAGNIGNGCESVQIGTHRIYAIVPKGHPLSDREMIEVEELKDYQLIQIDANSNMDLRIQTMLKEANIAPRVQYVADWTAQQLYVINGRGIALSCDVASDERFLCKIPINSEHSLLPLYLTWASKQKLSGAAVYVRDYYLRLAKYSAEELVF